MRRDFDSEVFGQPKDESFDGEDLYSSIEQKAAHLLYLVTKNHSFVDGNKHIAAVLFLIFLAQNNHLFTPEGRRRLSTEGLATLTILNAPSEAIS